MQRVMDHAKKTLFELKCTEDGTLKVKWQGTEEQAHDISLPDIMEDIAPTQISKNVLTRAMENKNVFVTICCPC